MVKNVIDRICNHEGFRPEMYQDHLGNWTIGHGITTITEDESRMVVSMRVALIDMQLMDRIDCYYRLNDASKAVLIEMAYQMGVEGLMKFKRFIAALCGGRYYIASAEMLDSKWADQTPNRAKKLAEIILEAGDETEVDAA